MAIKTFQTIALISFLLANFINCSTIDIALSKKVDLKKKLEKVAVFPFDVKGARWGDEFADAITHYFFKSGKVEVAERDAIKKIFKEQGLSISGALDPNKAVKIGKLLGVDVIIMGRGNSLRLTDDGKKVNNLIDTFSLRAISVEKGNLLITVRKEPGAAWDLRYRAKFCCSLSLIWDTKDILIQSSRYDDISEQIVNKILESILEIEKKKKDAVKNGVN